jgi:subtilisin family serine protease
LGGPAAIRIGGQLLIAALCVAATAGNVAAAVRLDPEFVALLAHRGTRRHPFADVSGRLPLVLEVPASRDVRALGWLPLSPGFATARVAPEDLGRFVAAHPGVSFSVWPGLHPVLDASARLNRVDVYRAALAAQGSPRTGTGRGVVIGVVDTGVDVTHPDLRDATGGTRIAWMLDFSRSPLGRHPELEQAFGCASPAQSPCAVLDKSDIDRALAGDPSVDVQPDTVGHGTHVASIAAGNGGPDARYRGGAPEATIIVASVSHGDLAGTVADVDVVTAARFVFDRADAMGLPAVVNLSLGGDFGPHDGTTPIEQSLAALVGPAHPGRSIVVAAGNSGALYQGDEQDQVLGIHTETRVTAGLPAVFTALVPDGRKGSDVSGSGFVWITYRAGDDIAIGIEGPSGLLIRPVGAGRKAGFRADDESLTAGIYNGAVGAESPLPAGSHGAIVVWDGRWPASGKMTIQLEGEGFADAWVEARFDDTAAGPIFFDLATRAGTINLPASHPDLIAVGCSINRTEWIDRDLVARDIGATAYAALAPTDGTCYFTSAGPTATGGSKPDLSAPGAMVAAAMSRDAVPGASPFSAFSAPAGLCTGGGECLVVDEGHALLSGSSMSAPQVAGAVALLFERDPRLVQSEILHLLQGGARRPMGHIASDLQLGAGALDVAGAMDAYEARTSGRVRDPDAPASWLSLANSYLHPGSGPPLTGTVEVRAADGSVADGYDPGRLTLEVGEEGVVEQPLARVSAGLYRFAVRARSGTGTRFLRLDVKIDGVPVGPPGSRISGHRLIPIGADRWVASGTARLYGGCSVGPSGRARGIDGGAGLATTVLALFGVGRRRCHGAPRGRKDRRSTSRRWPTGVRVPRRRP